MNKITNFLRQHRYAAFVLVVALALFAIVMNFINDKSTLASHIMTVSGCVMIVAVNLYYLRKHLIDSRVGKES